MMFCKYCGAQLDDNAAFCPTCGKKQQDNIPTVKTKPSKKFIFATIAVCVASVIAGFFVKVCIDDLRHKSFEKKWKLEEVTKGWTATDTFSLDEFFCYPRYYVDNDGITSIMNCYSLTTEQFNKLWNNFPKILVYGSNAWNPFEAETYSLSYFNDNFQALLKNYDVICSPIYQNGTQFYIFTYLSNHETGEVKVF